MIKIAETYTDYNGVERTEDFFFNFSKAEILEMEMSVDGGFAERIQSIVKAKDMTSLMKTFKDLVLKAYGVKSQDGRRFVKNEALREEFSQTEAYSNIFMRLATNDEEAAAFVNGIIPADLSRELAKQDALPLAGN